LQIARGRMTMAGRQFRKMRSEFTTSHPYTPSRQFVSLS
jgi:hypothetical protein